MGWLREQVDFKWTAVYLFCATGTNYLLGWNGFTWGWIPSILWLALFWTKVYR